MEWHIIGILAFVVIYNLYRYYHENNDNDYSPVTATTPNSNHIEETRMEETMSTRQLAFKPLRILGVSQNTLKRDGFSLSIKE